MTRTKIFSRIFKDQQGKCGFTTIDNQFIAANSMRYKDMFILFKVGFKNKGRWLIMSTSPYKKLYKNRQYYLINQENKEIPYNILFNMNDYIVDNKKKVVRDDSFTEYQNEFISKTVQSIGYKDTNVFVGFDIVILGQHIDEENRRFPVSINVKNTNDFLYYDKSLIKDEEIIMLNNENIVSAQKPVIQYESEMYNKAVEKWLEGFDPFFIMNKDHHKDDDDLKKIFNYILNKII